MPGIWCTSLDMTRLKNNLWLCCSISKQLVVSVSGTDRHTYTVAITALQKSSVSCQKNVLVQVNYNCLVCVARLTRGCCNDDQLRSVDHSLQQVHDSEVPSIHLDALANWRTLLGLWAAGNWPRCFHFLRISRQQNPSTSLCHKWLLHPDHIWYLSAVWQCVNLFLHL